MCSVFYKKSYSIPIAKNTDIKHHLEKVKEMFNSKIINYSVKLAWIKDMPHSIL